MFTQLNDQIVLFQTIQFCMSHLCACSLIVKQFYLTHRYDPIRCCHSRPEWSWDWWQWRGILHFSELQHCWNLTIRLFCVISWTLIGGVLPLCRDAVSVFYNSSRLSLPVRVPSIGPINPSKNYSYLIRILDNIHL